MNHKEKKEILKSINEAEFRRDIIIPLLSKMGYIAPVEYHGSRENGKDIICFEYDKLGEQRFLAIVAKKGDLTGSASSNQGLMTVVNQIQQAFDSPYEDLFNMKQLLINEVWVMTTGNIVSGAEKSVINTLRKSNLDKNIRFIKDDRLVQLIDENFSTYWNSDSETKESVIIQRDRLLVFIENLLKANHLDKSKIETLKSTILYSEYSPRMVQDIDGLHVANISPWSIELSKIDRDFDDYIPSYTYGVTKEIFAEAKQNLSKSFYYIEDTIYEAERISKITNPKEFVNETLSRLDREYPFDRPYGDASKFMDNITYLQEGLNDLKFFKDFLKHKNVLEWSKELSKSIPKLLPEIVKIVDNCKEEMVNINFSIDEEEKAVFINYDTNSDTIKFKVSDKRIDKSTKYGRDENGLINSNHLLESTLFAFRKYLETKFNYDEGKWLEDYVE
ncbi:hypothetical protein [Zunongwangia profunda]|jgi:hypothetical protein|uniref:hypothetical protein n=1 Tax=Zunongwangia profunda TaxID=398743 RepID=UPI001D180AD4|nr:hypothetical protein [Zunongwangia profunda]MCC4229470.1 hypothetical protein [Zunongwangia profunda]|tara:strand:+ start:425 stop:1765 length:1341 start_codon:yes stop_codon:yes gene_type:complete